MKMNEKPELKLIVAGGRDFNDMALMSASLITFNEQHGSEHTISIVSGTARGADRLGIVFAKHYGIQVHEFPADWPRYGKRAGFIRNDQMRDFADAAIVFWDGQSRGSKHMIDAMKSINKLVQVINY